MSDPVYEAGMSVRREVLGDAHVDRAINQTTDLTAPFQDFITRYAWGSVWTREGLGRETRSAITLAILAALGRENEIEMHVRGALRNGLTPAEIGEVLLQAHRRLRRSAGGQRGAGDSPTGGGGAVARARSRNEGAPVQQ